MRTEENVVDAQPRIARPAIPHVVPERIEALILMSHTDRVGPALLEKTREGRTAFRLHQRILVIGARRIDVALGWYNIVVADQRDRYVGGLQRAGVPDESFQPGELVIE